MLKILRLGRYALKVADIERSGRFYREILGLHEHERGPRGEAYFQRGPDHHCLVLYPADAKDPDDPGFPDGPILHHTAWEVASETELEKARRILEGEGIEILAGPKTHPGPGRHTYLRFQDPFGVPYELFCGMEQAVETAAEKPFQPQRLGHVGLGTKDLDGSVKFATEVLGFRISDWVRGVLCFVRCNEDHHALTFVQSGVHNLHHAGYETGDFEGIKRFADHASANNVFLEWGPGRRPPGETLFAYSGTPTGTSSRPSPSWSGSKTKSAGRSRSSIRGRGAWTAGEAPRRAKIFCADPVGAFKPNPGAQAARKLHLDRRRTRPP